MSDQTGQNPPELPDQNYEKSKIAPGMYKPVPEQDVFSWVASGRPFKKHNKQFFTYMSVIALLISMILFFTGQFLPIAVVISVVFLVYVLSVVPPHMATYKITTYGIRIDNKLYVWEVLGRFWFSKKYDQDMLSIETAIFPGRLVLMTGSTSKNLLKNILSEVILEEKPKDTLYEKSAKWLQEKIPLET